MRRLRHQVGRVGPGSDERLEDVRPGGLGVHIMKTLARSVEYSRANERNNLDIVIQVGAQDEPSPSST